MQWVQLDTDEDPKHHYLCSTLVESDAASTQEGLAGHDRLLSGPIQLLLSRFVFSLTIHPDVSGKPMCHYA